jgi:hypothetical protein
MYCKIFFNPKKVHNSKKIRRMTLLQLDKMALARI